ncbi:MAG: nickel pincer cofactor biosynthesis protein LarB [Clostridia bacterium]|nr:nickel pincer cofactor biosynthesis protein LarB [Clostridia bacterium]
MDIKTLLEQVAQGSLSTNDAFEQLKTLPFEDMGYACLDHHRKIRTGFPEVVFCQSKLPEQVGEIFERLYKMNGIVLGTRASSEYYESVLKFLPNAIYHEQARCITVGKPENIKGLVAVCTGGTADIPVAEEAAITAQMCGANITRIYDVGVAGIHRLLSRVDELRKANVIVACAGMEGALASVIGGLVDVPVIAVPTSIGYGANFGGVSALLAMLNSCSAGTSVVNIDNGFGAGYIAAQINSLGGNAQ